jgi:hypothetical protein
MNLHANYHGATLLPLKRYLGALTYHHLLEAHLLLVCAVG